MATTLTTVDLDPVFIKALEYLRCKNTDSTEKLSNILTEVLENPKKRLTDQTEPNKLNRINQNKQNKVIDTHKKERDLAQKRQYDKIHKDLDELNNDNKKLHTESSDQISVPTSNIPKFSAQLDEQGFINEIGTNQFGSNSDIVGTADDFELEMEGLSCVECSQMTVGSGNQLVECQECHNLYHQDCHMPYISDAEVNDPRYIWHCSQCKKSMKKQEKQNSIKTPPSVLSNSHSNEKRALLNEAKNKSNITPFKRSELKTSIASTTSNVSMSGWAALSGKPIPPLHKQSHEHNIGKSLDNREKHKHHKEKNKVPKNYSKHNNAKMVVSDVWAEALGAQNTPQSATNNNSKHVQLSSGSWLSGSLNSNNTSKASANLKKNSHKSSAFPKASASSHNVDKNSNGKTQNPDLKRLHSDKKKLFSKIQSKRKHV